MLDDLRVTPGASARLDRRDPAARLGLVSKEAARAELADLQRRMADVQVRLFAEGRTGVLVVLQAMDAGGKDGTIRTVFTGLNPAGVTVTGFKAPSERELAHDYLWRLHPAVPARGQIGIWNRSHYEDVVVVRVKELVPPERWRRRFRHLREFERMLVDEGIEIVKVYLNISSEEQRARLQDRVDDPTERWKFRLGDLDDRKLWHDFQRAYAEAIEETSTEQAPWFVVPGDRKWVRNVAVARIVLDALERIDPQFPPPEVGIDSVRVEPIDG
jgi:PPK2 family polyphosphate:nucleotide phosphotransferase